MANSPRAPRHPSAAAASPAARTAPQHGVRVGEGGAVECTDTLRGVRLVLDEPKLQEGHRQLRVRHLAAARLALARDALLAAAAGAQEGADAFHVFVPSLPFSSPLPLFTSPFILLLLLAVATPWQTRIAEILHYHLDDLLLLPEEAEALACLSPVSKATEAPLLTLPSIRMPTHYRPLTM